MLFLMKFQFLFWSQAFVQHDLHLPGQKLEHDTSMTQINVD